jgi:hypothetical protein
MSHLSRWVSLGLLTPGESPRGHEIFYHGAILEIMSDGV